MINGLNKVRIECMGEACSIQANKFTSCERPEIQRSCVNFSTIFHYHYAYAW